MDIYKQAEIINDKADFLRFLELLKKNLAESPEEWENDTLESFFEGLSGYCEDTRANVPSWRLFADLMLGAKVYE